jgi:serine/threonine protein kinase
MALDDQPGNDETQPGVSISTASGQPKSRRSGRRESHFEVAPGDVLGDYEIERRLGAGGMGEVFAAHDRRSGERVALKVLAQAGSTALVRFKREFRALADVKHANLVSLRELVVPADGVPFFTMELIDGVPFNAYVRGRTPVGHLPNLVRLGRALGQLVIGIHHLHLAQCLHRDVKPSNVMVARAGRVVILDFGLVSELAGLDKIDVGLTHDGAPLGTPAYMAPEQALSGNTTPASDFYAIGVMVYECLTGSLPFQGSAIEVMLHKQDGEIPDPQRKVADVPPALRSLCMRLLARDPESRPSGPELLAELERLDLGANNSSSSSDGTHTPGSAGFPAPGASGSFAALSISSDARIGNRAPFIGRRRELSLLSTALRDVEETETAVTVHVHGTSGFGKSALLARFLARVRRKHDVTVLAARCLERESVPYKGVDAIIDALSLQLRRMPAVERAALQPRGLGALTRIFPVLGDVWETPVQGSPGDAAELRRIGLAGLRELIQRLSARKPIVVSIDDFQWADVDSVRLLNSLMRPPNPPALLVMLAFREDLELRPSSRDALAELTEPAALGGRDVRELVVGPLEARDALDLAMKLMGDAAEPALARSHVERAGANPFHLVQITLAATGEGAVELTLDEILARRIVDLEPSLHRLLAVVSAAGGPVELEVLLELLELEPPASVERAVDSLCGLGLLVRPRSDVRPESTTDSHSGDMDAMLDRRGRLVETANLRIREVVLSQLETDELRVLHLQLAEVLARHDADLEAIAEHLVRGGEAGRAADLTERAAEQAANTLAFARAVELYERTLELLPSTASGVRRRTLRLALAHQLANLGRNAAAADMLLELAVVAQPVEARSLRRRAAEQLLRSGRIDEGIDLSRTSFTELGEPMPRGFWSTVWMIVRERLRLWVRGGVARARLRPESEVPEQLLTRLDLISNVATGLSLQELILTQALHSRALVLACEAGEPRRLGIVLTYEFVALAALGHSARARAMLVECRELATRVQGGASPELDRAIDLSEAMLDWFGPRMPQARARLAKLLRRLEEAPGADWVRAYAAIRYAETCVYGGWLGELRRELPRWISTARERGNLHELASMHGLAATLCLYFDDQDGARRNLEAGRECWDSSRYTVPDLTLDLSAVNVRLYDGDFTGARAEIERVSSNLRSSGMGRIPFLREMLEQARGRCSLREAVRKPDDLALRREVQRACVQQRRFTDPLYRGEARINAAAWHSLLGEREAARRCWREAAIHLEEHAMAAQLAAVRLRLASVTSGRESAELEALGEAYLREHGIPNRARFVDWIAPAHLDRRRSS